MRPVVHSQRGVALMTAIILVALAAVLAVGIAFSSAMSARRAAAVFSVEQGLMFAAGAEALAAYVLAEDAVGNNTEDTPIERWNDRYGPVEVAPEVSLEAQILDLSGKFNLNSLVAPNGEPDPIAVEQFKYLLRFLSIEEYWAELLVDWIDTKPEALDQGGEDSLYLSQSPPYLAANLPITSITELLELPKFGAERYAKLSAYVTALPTGTKLNTCMAAAEVIDAFVSGIGESEIRQYQNNPQTMEAQRKLRCFPTSNDIKSALTADQQGLIAARIAQTSDYFRLQTWVSIGTTRFALYSLMLRENQGVRPVLRTYGTE